MAHNAPYSNESNSSGATSSTGGNPIGTLLKKLDADNDGVLDPGLSGTVGWADVTDKPTTFTAAAHTHGINEITNLQTSLDGKAATGHGHQLGDLSNVDSTTPSTGQVLKFDGTNWAPGTDASGSGSGGSTFVSLDDTPSSFTANKWIKVNSAGNALEETDGPVQNVVTTSDDGLAPQLPASHGGKFLKADGTWEVPPDNDTTYSAGNAIDITSGTINHEDTSTVSDSDNADGTVVQDLTFDTFGHVQTVGTVDLDTRFSLSTHDHSSVYAPISHNHSGTYEPADATIAKTGAANNFTAAQSGAIDTTQASTGVCDLSEGNNHEITISGSTTISVSNPVAGMSGVIKIIHDGSNVPSFSGFKFAGGTAPTVTNTASNVDILAYYCESTSRISAVYHSNMS